MVGETEGRAMERTERHARTSRVHAEEGRAGEGAFTLDVERIQFSPYFSRLSAVTQVVSPTLSGAPVHNRLTHSLKVGAIARAIAHRLVDATGGAAPDAACDPTVVEAAALAHDLGHPPFGHLGEAVLDRIARVELGLPDGFEGNAQTYRILTALDVIEAAPTGLNLTAAVRTAAAKYPWAASVAPAEIDRHGPPRGIRRRPEGGYAVSKYSAYAIDAADLAEARAQCAAPPLRQSVEGAIMDIADDIAYSVHDLEDFYRAGILDHASIAAEFRGWLSRPVWHSEDHQDVIDSTEHGAALERLRRKMRRDDDWVADDDAFRMAVVTVDAQLIDELLSRPYDGSLTAERALSSFSDRWIRTLQHAVVPTASDSPRSGPVTLSPTAWHIVEVLKFVHKNFVLSRPDLAIHQRGLSRILTRTVRELDAWLDDEQDRLRVPRRLRELIALAHAGYAALDASPAPDELARLARGRGIMDYVATLNDTQAFALSEAISGRADGLWAIGQQL
ncbi:MAG: deoxyguanosinetriphosphate triphosphohydrolase family protein [Actinomycetota bacterium]